MERNKQSDREREIKQKYPLATLSGLEYFLVTLILSGSMCPACGYGTRKTSKRWARCKKCYERVPIREQKEVEELIKKATT